MRAKPITTRVRRSPALNTASGAQLRSIASVERSRKHRPIASEPKSTCAAHAKKIATQLQAPLPGFEEGSEG
eukprot:15431376-Alexandrium_andersonii.AAC.1